MKLFLSSKGINTELREHFFALVGKKAAEIRFALIENAADPYPDHDKDFVLHTRHELESLGVHITLIDLRMYQYKSEQLAAVLKDYDVVWVGGGNVYYLRWLMQTTGLDTIIKHLLESGIVYGGGSAGSIVTCPTLDAFDLVDSLDAAPEVNKHGLTLIDFIIIPHWGTPEFHNELEKIKYYYDHETDYEIVTITDNEAIIVNENEWKVYPHKALERDMPLS